MKLSHVKLNEVNEKKCKMKLELKWSDMKVNKGTNTWSGLVYWMEVTQWEWIHSVHFTEFKWNWTNWMIEREARRHEFNAIKWNLMQLKNKPRREWVTAIQLIQPTSFHAFNWNEEGINEFQHEWPKAWRINSINHFISPNLRRMKRDWMKSQQCKRG